jgi:hypothetical protein
MRNQEEILRRKAVVLKHVNGELFHVMMAELKDRHEELLIRLENADIDDFQYLQGAARQMTEVIQFFEGCLRIKNE